MTLTHGANVLRFQTRRRAQTETGTWRWVVKGAGVRIPSTYPAGRYTVRGARRGAATAASGSRSAAHDWRATVKLTAARRTAGV